MLSLLYALRYGLRVFSLRGWASGRSCRVTQAVSREAADGELSARDAGVLLTHVQPLASACNTLNPPSYMFTHSTEMT